MDRETHVLVVVIGMVFVVVTTDVAAGWVYVDVSVDVVPGAVLYFGPLCQHSCF